MERLTSLWSELAGRFAAFWQNQNRQTRTIAVAGTAVVLAGLLALGWLYFGRGQNYVTLFANLSPEDASAVTQHLKDDKVPYRLSADGKTVYVPEADQSDERVAIAGSGLIKGGATGYELFDRTNFGMTEFQEKIDKTRAIEGELERTIDGLDPVESSRVNIATPDQTLYSTTQEPTTASIAIKTKPGQSLGDDQVRGITMLVANAVDGLKPENVTIVNQDGQILLPGAAGAAGSSADGTAADALKLTQEQLLAKERYESALQTSIQSMLDDTLGKRRAVARVSTKMDFDANSSESKIYAPQGTVLSNQSERESYVGTQPVRNPAQGIPGTTSNIGTYQATQQQANGRYNRSKTTTNYDISEQNVKHIDAPGKVLQTSVAVLVDSSPQIESAGGVPAIAAQPYQLTPANVAQIRNAVIAAAGLNVAQGDQVSVEAIPFNPSVENLGAPSAVTTTILGIPLWALIVVGGVAALAGIGLLVARSRRGRFAPATELPSFDTSLAEELPPFEEHPILEGAPGIAAPIRSAADLTREQMIEYVTTVAQENPDSIAKLVKLWLAE
ncbi:MAG TPA: flagellar basal-body MS-ring/collar protein FliF [Candidatus Acidoferrales bacterium]|nr:flagellar basal-body MS-ring/collar protein FliF [Candidatus Acidoferrales bacterium]HTX57782.1 flagellar basal-body MS-ring/collar protein FliF [Candidatus Acidoferrales bacterium]